MLANYGQSLTLWNIFSTSPLIKDTVLVNGISFEKSISTLETSTISSPRPSLSMLPLPHSCLLTYLMFLRFYNCAPIKLNTSSGWMTNQISASLFGDLFSQHWVSRTLSSSFPKDMSHPFPHLGLSSDLRSFSADILLSYYIALVS